MTTHKKSLHPKSALRLIGILVLILLTLSGVFVAFRYQQPLPVCGDQFAAGPERFSQQWWTCPRELNRHARVVGNIGNKDFVDVKFSTDNLHGWALSKDGQVFGTVDGGLQWTMLGKPETGLTFSELRFDEDGLHAWLLGGSAAWAFGPGSTEIFSSNDGGKTWISYEDSDVISGLKNNSSSMVWAKDGKRVWIIGEQSTILHSNDGGKQWKQQFTGIDDDILFDVAFDKEGKIGWAVGEVRSILKTTDGGEHWQRVRNFPQKLTDETRPDEVRQFVYYSVHVSSDGQQIWMVGEEGKIAHSSDAGLHWNLQQTPSFGQLTDLQISEDGLHGWTISNKRYIDAKLIETHDAGKTWLEKKMPANFAIRQVTIAKDNQHIWMVGAQGSIIASNDAGVSWTTQASQFSATVTDLNMHTVTERGWFVSNKGLWRSLDNGDTWMVVFNDDASFIAYHNEPQPRISFDASGQLGMIFGDWKKRHNYLASTLDGGDTWQQISPRIPQKSNESEEPELDFSTYKVSGMLINKGGQQVLIYDLDHVLTSSDHGTTWSKKPRTDTYNDLVPDFAAQGFCSVKLHTGNVGDIMIWKEQADLQTSNFCKFFEYLEKSDAQTDSQSRLPAPYHFPLKNVEVQNKSERKWELYGENKNYPILWLSLTEDGKHGIAIGRNYEKIIASEDNGEHWREYAIPSTSRLNTVRYSSDEKQAWAVGEHNAMFMSEDNGKTWQAKGQYQRLPPPWFYALCLGLGLISAMLMFVWIWTRYLKKSKQTES